MSNAISSDFWSHFETLEDPRVNNHHRRHELKDRLVLVILGVISGAEVWVDIEQFGRAKEDWLKTFLSLPNGIPSHDTLGRVFSLLSARQLQSSFLCWVQSLVTITENEIVAIDGKTLRRSHNRSKEKAAIHMVSAWASRNGLVLGQVKTVEKSNEITAIPALPGMLSLEGKTVTIDAMGCQKAIAQQIVEQGGDDILALKGNQSTLHEDVALYLDDQIAKEADELES